MCLLVCNFLMSHDGCSKQHYHMCDAIHFQFVYKTDFSLDVTVLGNKVVWPPEIPFNTSIWLVQASVDINWWPQNCRSLPSVPVIQRSILFILVMLISHQNYSKSTSVCKNSSKSSCIFVTIHLQIWPGYMDGRKRNHLIVDSRAQKIGRMLGTTDKKFKAWVKDHIANCSTTFSMKT